MTGAQFVDVLTTSAGAAVILLTAAALTGLFAYLLIGSGDADDDDWGEPPLGGTT
jgi:hypothetical protein